MKYPTLTLGRIEAILNKLGGEEGVRQFLRGASPVESPIRIATAAIYGRSVDAEEGAPCACLIGADTRAFYRLLALYGVDLKKVVAIINAKTGALVEVKADPNGNFIYFARGPFGEEQTGSLSCDGLTMWHIMEAAIASLHETPSGV